MKDVDIKLKFHEEKMEMKAKYNVLEKKYKETLVSLVSSLLLKVVYSSLHLFHHFISKSSLKLNLINQLI